MANRRANKKLRARIHERMRRTGESYQAAHRRLTSAERAPSARRTARPACVRWLSPDRPLDLWLEVRALFAVGDRALAERDGEGAALAIGDAVASALVSLGDGRRAPPWSHLSVSLTTLYYVRGLRRLVGAPR